jgi:hypothetical protein
MPYLYGLKETVKNRNVVVKINNKSPYVIPFLFFSLPTIVINIIFLFTDFFALFLFFILYFISLVCYFSGIYILIRNLKEKIEYGRTDFEIDKDESIKKLLLINPVNKEIGGLTINPSSTFPPLGLGIIATLTPENFKIKLIDENFNKFEYEDADLVGITAFTSVANRAYEIAAQYRSKNIPVIMGGIHTSMVPEEAFTYVDSIVIGEAESIWPTVINDFLNNKLEKKYVGVHLDLENALIPKRTI